MKIIACKYQSPTLKFCPICPNRIILSPFSVFPLTDELYAIRLEHIFYYGINQVQGLKRRFYGRNLTTFTQIGAGRCANIHQPLTNLPGRTGKKLIQL
jgi:hypothetical protein